LLEGEVSFDSIDRGKGDGLGDLSRCEGSRCREEDCLDEHVDFTLSKSESFVWLLR
jgi:hypothetical protein